MVFLKGKRRKCIIKGREISSELLLMGQVKMGSERDLDSSRLIGDLDKVVLGQNLNRMGGEDLDRASLAAKGSKEMVQ